MQGATNRTETSGFWVFYQGEYRSEHRHPANVALHMLGTLAGLGWLTASFTIWSIWWALLFPVVHVLPGLVGHRLFERSEAVGDARVLRTDHPIWWFVLGNHIMTLSWPLRLFGYRP